MAEQVFEFVAGTNKVPPQVRNEHLGTEQQVADAHAAVDAWYVANTQQGEN